MFRNMQIKTRLILLVSVIAAMMLVSITYLSISSNRALEHLHKDANVTIDNVRAFGRIVFLMTRNRVILMDAGINYDPARLAKREAEFYKNRDEISDIAKVYEAAMHDEKQRELYETWKLHRIAYVKEGLEPMLAALKAGNVAEAFRIEREKVSVLNEPIKSDVEAINNHNLEMEKMQESVMSQSVVHSQIVTISIAV